VAGAGVGYEWGTMPQPEQTQPNHRSKRPANRRDDGPVIPDRASSDSDAAWGDGGGERTDDWYESQRPPHHGDV